MHKFAIFFLLPCLLLAACSTTPVTLVKYTHPSAGLLIQCEKPRVRKSEFVRDLVANSNARMLAWEKCNERHEALLKWHEEMRTKEGTTTDGGKSAPRSSP